MNETVMQRAYGRVNLIGEHTDYNGGWVLPTAIPQYTQVALTKRSDQQVVIESSADRRSTFELGKETPTHDWSDYLKGATKFLREAVAPTQTFQGFNAHINSSIPEGSGLSSSAALEMSFLKGIREIYELKISDVELALIGQKVENDFVGARVGIMDQMACALAKPNWALFLDTKTLLHESIRLPMNEMDLLVINSGISHKLSAKGGYNARRAQCEEVCARLNISQLRDLTLEELNRSSLPDVLMKRARHVVTENARVHQAVRALREKDPQGLGRLFNESHQSMRDNYEVSIPEIDLLVELCLQEKTVFGARLTGGGFGGSIVAITMKQESRKIAQRVLKSYQEQTRHKASVIF